MKGTARAKRAMWNSWAGDINRCYVTALKPRGHSVEAEHSAYFRTDCKYCPILLRIRTHLYDLPGSTSPPALAVPPLNSQLDRSRSKLILFRSHSSIHHRILLGRLTNLAILLRPQLIPLRTPCTASRPVIPPACRTSSDALRGQGCVSSEDSVAKCRASVQNDARHRLSRNE